ncbi:MAG: hypothetical protein HFF21_10145 [Oscillospiraceae bacterium]|jgi:hypothetical protein|nr:hypothetical protein [Oscillospiraceae bacterium]
MSLLLKDRDYVRDGNGGIAVARDGEALVNEALFRLTARRESFPFLPGLGSRMGELRREKPSGWDALARQFAVEALDELEDVTVTGARVRQERDALLVSVDLLWQGQALSVTARWEE